MSFERIYDTQTMSALAQEANGGPCAIAVGNILNQLDKLPITEAVSEVYASVVDPEYGLAVPGFVTVSEIDPDDSHRWYKKDKTVDGGFRGLSDTFALETGVEVKLGFWQKKLGLLTVDDSFIPLVELTEPEQKEDGSFMCSAAYLLHAGVLDEWGDSCISTTIDEQKVIVAHKQPEGYVLVRSVVERIWRMQELATQTGEIQSADDGPTWLAECLGANTALFNALELNPRKDYGPEQALRTKVQRIRKSIGSLGAVIPRVVLLDRVEREGDNGPLTDSIILTNLETDDAGLASVVQSIEFPAAQHGAKTMESLRLELGNRLGQAALVFCLGTSKNEFDRVAIELAGELQGGIKPGLMQVKVPSNRHWKRRRTYNPESPALWVGLEQSSAWGGLDPEARETAVRATAVLANRFGLRPIDMRLVKRVIDADHGKTTEYIIAPAGQGVVHDVALYRSFCSQMDIKAARVPSFKTNDISWVKRSDFLDPGDVGYLKQDNVFKPMTPQVFRLLQKEADDGVHMMPTWVVNATKFTGYNAIGGSSIRWQTKEGTYMQTQSDGSDTTAMLGLTRRPDLGVGFRPALIVSSKYKSKRKSLSPAF